MITTGQMNMSFLPAGPLAPACPGPRVNHRIGMCASLSGRLAAENRARLPSAQDVGGVISKIREVSGIRHERDAFIPLFSACNGQSQSAAISRFVIMGRRV
jgi:hypothetical protein